MVTLRWPNGTIVDPDVAENFTCLQQTGKFCATGLQLRPFIQALPIPAVAQPVAGLNPPPDPRKHQRFNEFRPVKFYDIHARAFPWRFHPDLAPSTLWGYDGMSPGPTFHARYGEPILVRFHNDLPIADNGGFGVPEDIVHVHNGHTASESDGFPADFYPPGAYKDHHYANVCAGADSREALGTLWYHNHRFDFTSQNVYKGLAGFFLLFDEQDSGNENDPNPKAFRLPSGEFDIPLMFADKRFDHTPDHQLYFDVFNLDGFLGDQFTVNGAVQPYLKVARRKYRFRLLNVGPSRFYEFFLSNGQSFTVIGNDGNLMPEPLTVPSVRVAVAERMDVIVDFSKVPIGTELYLENRLDQINGKGPTGRMLEQPEATRILKLIVDRDAPDPSRVPARLRELPPADLKEIVTTRTWVFDNQNGAWTVNGKFFDFTRIDAVVRQGTAERWILKNASKDWSHPIHIHLEEQQILSRDHGPPPLNEKCRKDVTELHPGEEVELFIRVRDWLGRYPMHCHNAVHEDHAMMIRWQVVP